MSEFSTTAEHFEVFQTEALRFIRVFGLHDWKVSFRHENLERSLAICEHNTDEGKVSTLVLSTTWGDTDPTNEALQQTAFHEVCHILLADAYDAACCFDLSNSQRYFHVDRAHHGIIRRLENIVLARIKDA